MLGRRLAWGIGGALVVAAAVLAARDAWINDDAYISFRYARHLVEGLGLVFNPGERVEGYTNFLWTVWLALGMWLGLGPHGVAIASGVAAYAGSVALLWRWTRRRGGWLPIAAVGALCHREWVQFATGGLETSLFVLLVLLAVTRVAERRRPLWTGVVLGLAILTRPDGALVAVVLGLWELAARPGGVRARLRGVMPMVLGAAALVGPFLAWRVSYYGAWVPNTYFAKSADRAWWSQGAAYAGLFFRQHWVLLAGILLWVVSVARGQARAAALLPLAVASVYTLWVIRVGGDFMHGRFLVPVVPLLLLAAEDGLRALGPRAEWLGGAGVVAALLAATPALGPAELYRGIANERLAYTDAVVDGIDAQAATLRRFFDGLDVRVAFFGGQARLVERARIPVAVESETGLTDRTIAHQPLARRGRIGHEKKASALYLIDERRVHFAFFPLARAWLGLDRWVPRVWVDLGGVEGTVLTWDPAMVAALRARGGRFQDFLGELDAMIRELPGLPDATVARFYPMLRRFYFEHAPDPAREAPFRRRLGL